MNSSRFSRARLAAPPTRTVISILVAACFVPIAAAQEISPAVAATIANSRAYALAEIEVRLASSRIAPRRADTFRLYRDSATIVAMLDTGVNVAHTNFVGRIAAGAYNTIAGSDDVSDTNGHGTLVASIITGRADPAGRGREPHVLPIKIFSGPSTTEAQVNAGLAYSIGR
jgi:subtilisin family serine protease